MTPVPPLEECVIRLELSLQAVRDRIAAVGRDPRDVTIVAVTKGLPLVAAQAALACGLRDLGENYADALVEKASVLASLLPGTEQPHWHFQGRLQTNKINRLAPYVKVWETVDDVHRAHALGKRVPRAEVFIQVNLTGEPDRGGCPWSDTEALVRASEDAGLHVRGLMGVGADPHEAPAAAVEELFVRLRKSADDLGLSQCSMGMSDDFETAVRVGSTEVRLGRVLFADVFGPRA